MYTYIYTLFLIRCIIIDHINWISAIHMFVSFPFAKVCSSFLTFFWRLCSIFVDFFMAFYLWPAFCATHCGMRRPWRAAAANACACAPSMLQHWKAEKNCGKKIRSTTDQNDAKWCEMCQRHIQTCQDFKILYVWHRMLYSNHVSWIVLTGCKHLFHVRCILVWSEVENSCPQCRSRFLRFGEYNISTGKLRKFCEVQKRDQIEQSSSEEVLCDVCGRGDEEDLLLLCDGRRGRCPGACHTFCDGLGRQVPRGRWLCLSCRPRPRPRGRRQTREPRELAEISPGSSKTETQGSSQMDLEGATNEASVPLPRLPPQSATHLPAESSQGADPCILLSVKAEGTEQADGVREAEAPSRVKRESEQPDLQNRFAESQQEQSLLETEEKKLEEADKKEVPGLRRCWLSSFASQRNSASPNDQKRTRIGAYWCSDARILHWSDIRIMVPGLIWGLSFFPWFVKCLVEKHPMYPFSEHSARNAALDRNVSHRRKDSPASHSTQTGFPWSYTYRKKPESLRKNVFSSHVIHVIHVISCQPDSALCRHSAFAQACVACSTPVFHQLKAFQASIDLDSEEEPKEPEKPPVLRHLIWTCVEWLCNKSYSKKDILRDLDFGTDFLNRFRGFVQIMSYYVI